MVDDRTGTVMSRKYENTKFIFSEPTKIKAIKTRDLVLYLDQSEFILTCVPRLASPCHVVLHG